MSAFADVELLLADPAMPESKRREGLQEIQTALRRIRDIVRQIGDLREIRTKSYVAGVRMVDLDAPGRTVPALSLGRAVVLLADEDLTRVVSLLLRHVGFEVHPAADVADLQTRAEGVGVRLVVVSGGSDAAGAHPFGGFQPAERRSYRLVALTTGDGAPARAIRRRSVDDITGAPGPGAPAPGSGAASPRARRPWPGNRRPRDGGRPRPGTRCRGP